LCAANRDCAWDRESREKPQPQKERKTLAMTA
jgi:hypothetical protein